MENSAAIVFVRAPTLGVVCVWEEGKRKDPEDKIYWKFPGGSNEPEDNDDWRKTAQRELAGETGVIVSNLDDFKLIDIIEVRAPGRPLHHRYVCMVTVSDEEAKFAPMWIGDENEIVRLIPYREFDTIPDFFPPHRDVLERHGLWPPAPPT